MANELPKWVQAIRLFVSDTVIDESYGYPMLGADDAVHDRLESAIGKVVCGHYGHDIVNDQCGIPEHRYCVRCHLGIRAIDVQGIDDVEGEAVVAHP